MITHMKLQIMIAMSIIYFNFVYPAFSQDESPKNPNELVISDKDLIIIFSSFIVSVIAIFLYLARHQILRKKIEYDMKDYESKKNKDYEKYHSDWAGDEVVGNKSFSKYEKMPNKMR